jgi:hypothetical protein
VQSRTSPYQSVPTPHTDPSHLNLIQPRNICFPAKKQIALKDNCEKYARVNCLVKMYPVHPQIQRCFIYSNLKAPWPPIVRSTLLP